MATAAKKNEAPQEPDNLAIWTALSKTDPAHTKGFSRAGGFKGTAIKPIWIIRRLTEQFGPVGVGWGMERPHFEVVPGDGEILVYCTVECWHTGPENTFVGVGGDKVVARRKDGQSFHDDEAFKKAFTDAVGNAFKFLGVGADVHMGLFEDNKYLEQTRAEFAANDQNGHADKVPGITAIKTRLRKLQTDGNALDCLDSFNALVHDYADDLQKIKDARHQWWTGDGGDSEGFATWIRRRRDELSGDGENAVVNGLIHSMKECETSLSLTNWRAANEEVIDALDGAEGRRFELAWNFHESAIREVEKVHN
jgi:hypothetical protein